MAAKLEVEYFNCKGKFVIWQRRMYIILVQQKVAKALKDPMNMPDTLYDDKKQDMLEMSFNTLTLHLDDNVLREFSFFGFKMIESNSLRYNLDEFNNILYLENIDIEIDGEDKEIIFLNSLSKSYSTFVETLKYARESQSFDDI